ncbi:hypothetical protein [Streptomyces sp. NPDC050145]|uniref:hypothetical protein n=1 Tax=Streptomyces sp. NPDC050145 TaxID=3365602 RepID=UPI0037A92F88
MPLLREHGDAVEADLAYRGFDLLDLWRGTLSPRKVDILIRGLPPDSATRQSLNDGLPLWRQTDFILADLVDATAYETWVIANKDLERHNRKPMPEPYPRPGLEVKKKITAADLAAFRARTRR